MDRQRWESVDRMFEAALERTPEDRPAFLDIGCAGDDELRAEVESLIAAHDREDGFLEPSRSVAAAADGTGSASPGEALGSYRIIRRLGRGGASEVYLAEDKRLRRLVAIKLLAPHRVDDRDSIRRLRREALAASALNHPNIVTIHEIGEWQGREFIAAEYVEGTTLRERMRREDSPLAAWIEIALQVTNALSAAHQAGIVHRDIKPENIMVRPDGLVKVLDFGIAKYAAAPSEAVAETESETATGVVLGTVAYMSPEQARGEVVDARTDIWSIGVVLYEMIAKRPPFPGATACDRVTAILDREPEPLRSLRRGIPAALDKVVKRALAKDRDSRYRTAAEIAEDLRSLCAKRGARRIAWKLALLAGIAAAVLPGIWYSRPVHAPSRFIGSLAVLPFTNASGSGDNEYLSDGITDSLINDLSDIGQLKVMSRNAVFAYKGRNVEAREVGRALDVGAVLTGHVTQRGDELSVDVEVADARDNSHIWGRRYDRKLASLMEIQEEIARQVTERLRLRVSRDESDRLSRRYTTNPEAYQLYLKGRFFWFKWALPSGRPGSAPDFGKSREYFQKAIEADPQYAPAYAFLGHYYAMSAGNGMMPPGDGWPKAEAAFQKARELDPSLPEAITGAAVIEWMERRDWAGAERMLRQAIRSNPINRPESLLGRLLAAEGRFDEAVAQARRAVELDPLSIRFSAGLARVYYYARRYEESISQYRQALELDPNDVFVHEALGDLYQRRGLERDAIGEWCAALTLAGDPSGAAIVDRAYRRGGFDAGARAQANANLRHLEQAARAGRYVPAIEFARVRLKLKQKNQALRWLVKACDERSNFVLFLNVDPFYDELRPDRRFQELARCIQAPR